MGRIELVGLDVREEHLKPGRYLAGSYANEEAEQYTPHIYIFELVGNLQLTYEHLVDSETGDHFGVICAEGTWVIEWKQGNTIGSREFSDICLFEVGEED